MAWNIAVVAALLLALGYIGFLHYRVYRRERALTRTDDLTHVENRRAFYEDAGREFERARRYNHPFTLAYFDVDDFKEVSDRFGHQLGDGILRLVAETARESVRASDLVARLGADQFALLLPEAGADAASAVIRKLQEALRHTSHGTGHLLVRGRGSATARGVRAGAAAPAMAPAAELRRPDAAPVRAVGLAGRHSATCTTRSFPPRFASYIAWSALRSSSSVPASLPVTDTTPMLAVTDGVPRNTVRMPAASRLAAACATVPSVSGIRTANSSPPSRPTTSAWRTALRVASATSRSTASPVAWPCASFTLLKSSKSR